MDRPHRMILDNGLAFDFFYTRFDGGQRGKLDNAYYILINPKTRGFLLQDSNTSFAGGRLEPVLDPAEPARVDGDVIQQLKIQLTQLAIKDPKAIDEIYNFCHDSLDCRKYKA